jgi:hypothetical protein
MVKPWWPWLAAERHRCGSTNRSTTAAPPTSRTVPVATQSFIETTF